MERNLLDNDGPGSTLKDAREKNGFTVDEVAKKLKIDSRYVIALENNEHDELPAPAFVKGYLRSYAHLVDMDVDEILDQYQKIAPPDPELTNTYPPRAQKQTKQAIFIWIPVLLILLSVAIFIYFSISQNGGLENLLKIAMNTDKNHQETQMVQLEADERENVIAENSVATEYQTLSEADHLQLVVDSDQLTDDHSSAEMDVEQSKDDLALTVVDAELNQNIQELQNDETVKAAAKSVNDYSDQQLLQIALSANPTAPVGDDTILLNTDSRSWIDVTDANGHRLMFKLLKRSHGEIILKGKAPFDVVLGNSPTVNIKFNGSEFDQSAYNKANRSARFTLQSSKN